MSAAPPRGIPRWLDVAIAGVGLVVAAVPLAVIALVVLLVHGRPVLHRSERTGLGERPFTLLKVRTMRDERAPSGELLPDAERLTALGRFLRTTSLDELPQLLNVIRGDMALVGPRPLPPHYLDRYRGSERRRHTVRPGITGWAQVNGRNTLGWDERLALDVWYVDHRTPMLDIRILVRTVGQVVTRRGISAEGEATMAELRPERGSGS